MGEEKKRLPVGVENFELIINDNYYYVDKTGLISELLRNGGMVNLFTRPRRSDTGRCIGCTDVQT